MYKVMCGLYLGLVFRYVASCVGEVPVVVSEVYSADLPFKALALVLLPALLGYLAGGGDETTY